MPYGIIKVDQVTFTNAGVDQTISVSGIVASISGNITATGTISGNVIRGGTTVSGATVTGNAGQFNTITGNIASFTSGVFAAGSATTPSISFTGDDNTGIYSPGADQVAVATNGTGRLFVDSSGNVSIGSSSFGTYSDRAISLYSTTNPSIKLSNSTTGSTLTDGIEVILSGSDGYLWNRENASWIFGTNNVERMRLTSTGLGVGTSTPGTTLDVAGTARANGLVSAAGNRLTLYRSSDSYAHSIYANSSNVLTFDTGVGGTGTTLMSLTDAGRLGVGTTSPGAPLEVIGTAGTIAARATTGVSSQAIQIYNNGTDSYIDSTAYGAGSGGGIVFRRNGTGEMGRFDTSGRLLVGTSTSSLVTKIHVQGSTSPTNATAYDGTVVVTDGATDHVALYAHNSSATGTTNGTVSLTLAPGGNGQYRSQIVAGRDGNFSSSTENKTNLRFLTAGGGGESSVERMRITSAGLVGIGTSAPATNLDVRGTASSTVEIVKVGNGTKYLGLGTEGTNYNWIQSFASVPLYINPQGNNTILNSGGGSVGIGTQSPGTSRTYIQADDTNTAGLTINGTGSSGGVSAYSSLKITGDTPNAVSTHYGVEFVKTGSNVEGITGYYADITGAYSTQTNFHAKLTKNLAAYTNGYCYYADLATSNSGGAAYFAYFYNSTSSAERFSITSAGTTTLTSAASTAPFIAKIGSSEVSRIDSSGRLLVGTSSSFGSGLLQVKGTINIQQTSGGADYETGIGSDAVSFVNISTTDVAGLPSTNGPGLYMFTIRTIGNHTGTFLVSAGLNSGSNYYYTGFGASGNVTLTNVSNGTITVVLLGDARTYTFTWPTDGQPPTFKASSTATGTTLVAVTSITTAI